MNTQKENKAKERKRGRYREKDREEKEGKEEIPIVKGSYWPGNIV